MIGKEIKEARKDAGMTQSELAEKCGLSIMTIRRYESGKRKPRYESLLSLRKALGIDKQYQAVEDIRALGRMGQNICPVCAHYNHGEGSKMCITCPKMDNFEWRGLVKEG